VRKMDLFEKSKSMKRVFTEDECAPDAESIGQAWRRLFGVERQDEILVEKQDGGDCMVFLYASGRVAHIGPPRCGWTSIFVPVVSPTTQPAEKE
jgi:hypothetical protein